MKSKSELVLLLNEADQFLSTRIEGGANGGEKMHNQMQNIFLERIEKFEGVLTVATNFCKGWIERFQGDLSTKSNLLDQNLKSES